jgi:hypothetical protein
MPSKKEKAEAEGSQQKVRVGTHGIFYFTTINELTLIYATTRSYPGTSRGQGSKEGRSQKGRYKDQARRKEEKDGVVKELVERRL